MIIPVIKSIYLNINGNPDCIDDFVIGGSANIGTEGTNGVDYFYFRLITPKRLITMLNKEKILEGKGMFIVNEPSMELNLKLLEAEINKIIKDCIRPTWSEVANAINRHLKWEYDNVKYETLEEMQERLNDKGK